MTPDTLTADNWKYIYDAQQAEIVSLRHALVAASYWPNTTAEGRAMVEQTVKSTLERSQSQHYLNYVAVKAKADEYDTLMNTPTEVLPPAIEPGVEGRSNEEIDRANAWEPGEALQQLVTVGLHDAVDSSTQSAQEPKTVIPTALLDSLVAHVERLKKFAMMVRRGCLSGAITSNPIMDDSDPDAEEYLVKSLCQMAEEALKP